MEKIGEHLKQALNDFRISFHEVYAKAVNYVVTGKVTLLNYQIEEELIKLLFVIGRNNRIVFVILSKKPNLNLVYCSCPDFIFNVDRKHGRPFCAHIIAAFLCLESITSATTTEASKPSPSYRCKLQESKLGVSEAISLCTDKLLISDQYGEDD